MEELESKINLKDIHHLLAKWIEREVEYYVLLKENPLDIPSSTIKGRIMGIRECREELYNLINK